MRGIDFEIHLNATAFGIESELLADFAYKYDKVAMCRVYFFVASIQFADIKQLYNLVHQHACVSPNQIELNPDTLLQIA